MPVNLGGKYAIKGSPEHISTYDDAPKAIRDLLKYACMSITAESAVKYAQEHGIRRLKAKLKLLTSENAKAAYGPDHPQAQ